jgi:pilus assembly protein TadC
VENKLRRIELSEREKILIITIGISIPLLILGYLGGTGVFGNTIILSVFIVVAPQLIFSYIEYRKLKEVENRFPSFLRNLTEAIRSEIPFHQAIIYVSRSDYGKLTPYVKKMANHILGNTSRQSFIAFFEQS